MSKKGERKFTSIRTRLFLQVGFIVLLAIAVILALNNFLLPNIYTRSELNDMYICMRIIDGFDINDSQFSQKIAGLERNNGFLIDIYLEDGTEFYLGANELFSEGGKITISDRKDRDFGAFTEILTDENTHSQYLVYGGKLSNGADVEIYSHKDTIDENANTAILITSGTSILALLIALTFIYFYTGKFTKPLIKMSRITGKMEKMDFSEKCEVQGNDEISMLSHSINEMSDSLDETLKDLKEKNERLQLDIEREKALDKMRKEFISNVSHELKTPISIIRGYSEGAELMLDNSETYKAKEYCSVIVRETEKMNALVYELLELSSYESGAVNVKKERFEIFGLVDDYAVDNEIKFKNNGITFINEVPRELYGSGDIVKLGMVLNNYISNAVSHADGDKIIKVTLTENENSYTLSVFNTGEHIKEEDLEKIWTSFYRADKSRSRNEGRFGLGLSIVSAIQKLHKMPYGAENSEGGVTFYFDIEKA